MEAIDRERAAKSRILAAAERIGTIPAALRSTTGNPDERHALYAEAVAELLETLSPVPQLEPEVEELAPVVEEKTPSIVEIVAEFSEESEADGKKRNRKG